MMCARSFVALFFLFLFAAFCQAAATVDRTVYLDYGPFSEGDRFVLKNDIYEYYEARESMTEPNVMRVTLFDPYEATLTDYNLSAVVTPSHFTHYHSELGCGDTVFEPDSNENDTDVFMGSIEGVDTLFSGGDIYFTVTNQTMNVSLDRSLLDDGGQYLVNGRVYIRRGPISEGDWFVFDGYTYEFYDCAESNATTMSVTLLNLSSLNYHYFNLSAVNGSSVDFYAEGDHIIFEPDPVAEDSDVYNGTYNNVPVWLDAGDLWFDVIADGQNVSYFSIDQAGQTFCRLEQMITLNCSYIREVLVDTNYSKETNIDGGLRLRNWLRVWAVETLSLANPLLELDNGTFILDDGVLSFYD